MVNFSRLWATFKARNYDFLRDRQAFAWNLLFPFLIVVGFGILFGSENQTMFKVGYFGVKDTPLAEGEGALPESVTALRYIHFIKLDNQKEGLKKLKQQKIDLLLEVGATPQQYWVNDSSPNGYVVEKMLMVSNMSENNVPLMVQQKIEGRKIRYVEWLFPGILGMNMMFSALQGVAFVIVGYRKNGVLKRLKATPLTAFEFLAAQLLSCLFLIMFNLVIVWVGCDLFFSFYVAGSYLSLSVVFLLGGTSLTALGLIFATRGTSLELINGVMSFVVWPMMFLSEVWFSIEGSPQWVKGFAQIFPLTHLLKAVRSIMNDGAALTDVGPELGVLALMTILFLSIGAVIFSWDK